MTIDEKLFADELEIFRKEEEAATQFFYAHLAIHAVAQDHPNVHAALNQAALFWNTCAGALQTAGFIALGRIFDQNSPHNLDRVLRVAQDHPEMFTKSALGNRRLGSQTEQPEWLRVFLHSAYEPKAADFRRLRGYVRKRRQIYEKNYRDLRNQFFAHKQIADDYVGPLFSKGSVRELQQLLTFLGSLYDSLWHLFNNGTRPVLRAHRYSVKRMRAKPSARPRGAAVQEHIVYEAEQFLLRAASGTSER